MHGEQLEWRQLDVPDGVTNLCLGRAMEELTQQGSEMMNLYRVLVCGVREQDQRQSQGMGWVMARFSKDDDPHCCTPLVCVCSADRCPSPPRKPLHFTGGLSPGFQVSGAVSHR